LPNGGWINAGIYLLGHELLRSIPEAQPVSLEREIFPGWVGRGLHAFPVSGNFIDIGTPKSFAAAQHLFV
jgi:NDP-sugar pyrophosphorylase family protein